MFYEWEKPFDERCLFLSEKLFAEFNSITAEGTGNLGENRVHGAYNRVRGKLASFLTATERGAAASIRIRSAPRRTEPEFFPSAFEAAMGVVHARQKIGSFAVDGKEIESISDLANRAAPIVFDSLGPAYGGGWDFPEEYGAEHYVAAVNTMPSGMRWGSNKEYSARLVHWMNNIWRRKFRATNGYFREIYPINYLLGTHLDAPFRGAPLSKFMEATGSLRPCEFNEKMYRWDILDENINEVRNELEPSGLVLSSPAEPLSPD
jgi:hypothetical protein